MCVCVCVFIKLHITAQPGPVKLIFQCYSNGSALWGISGVCFIKFHITAQPSPVKLIFQCYSNGSALWGISGVCFIKFHITAQPGPVKLIFQCYSNVCVCVCVRARYHINRSGPNLIIIHLKKQNVVADPARGPLDRRERGNRE